MGNNVSFSTRVRGQLGESRMIQNANERANSAYVCTSCSLRTDRSNVPRIRVAAYASLRNPTHTSLSLSLSFTDDIASPIILFLHTVKINRRPDPASINAY